MRADLHVHSNCSDGNLAPFDLMTLASQSPVKLIALTDHDNMEGLEEAQKRAVELGLSFVRGWEVSAYEMQKYDDLKVHTLGYRCRGGEAYRKFKNQLVEGAEIRTREMLERANAYLGMDVTVEDVKRFQAKKDTPIHATCVVRAFSNRLHKKMGEVFRELFLNGCPAYYNGHRPTPEEAIKVIHEDGGIAVLAHPGRILLGKEEKEKLINSLVDCGLDGIECTYHSHTDEEREYYERFARERGLLVTGGSDFHDDRRKRVIGAPEFHADEKLLSALFD